MLTLIMCEPAGRTFAVAVPSTPAATVQLPVIDEHAPDQLAAILPPVGAAVSAMSTLAGKSAVHADPHEMPLGTDVTVPVPPPVMFTVSSRSTPAWIGTSSSGALLVTANVPVVSPSGAVAGNVTFTVQLPFGVSIAGQLSVDVNGVVTVRAVIVTVDAETFVTITCAVAAFL